MSKYQIMILQDIGFHVMDAILNTDLPEIVYLEVYREIATLRCWTEFPNPFT